MCGRGRWVVLVSQTWRTRTEHVWRWWYRQVSGRRSFGTSSPLPFSELASLLLGCIVFVTGRGRPGSLRRSMTWMLEARFGLGRSPVAVFPSSGLFEIPAVSPQGSSTRCSVPVTRSHAVSQRDSKRRSRPGRTRWRLAAHKCRYVRFRRLQLGVMGAPLLWWGTPPLP